MNGFRLLFLISLFTCSVYAGPHVLFLLGEHEYGTKESLPAFADTELKPRGITYSFIRAKSDDRKSPDCHVFPGFAEALAKADVIFISVRRRYPPKTDMLLIKAWIASGKPVIAIRTSSHAFGEREKGQGYQAPPGHVAWQSFDRDVLGVSYTGHHGSKSKAVVYPAREVQAMPIWDGVTLKGEVSVDSHLYYSRDLDPAAIPLIMGRVEGAEVIEPVAWTIERNKGRRFYTSLGSVADMQQPFLRRLLVNAIYWSTKQAPSKAGAIHDLKENRTKEAHDDPLPAKGASNTLEVPDDLTVSLLLSEPVVEQPAFFNFDERGRMWVVQYRQYPEPAGLKMVSKDKFYRAVYDQVPVPPGHPDHVPGKDKITIHEDTNGDGQYDATKTFIDGLSIVTSCVRGRGGVFVLQPPYLLFYADKNNDDVPDGPPEVLLEGFGIEDTHSVCSSLCWGPDGWLYASQGSTVTSAVKIPGSEDPPVRRQGQLMWRYEPDEKRYEVFAEGGGNIWSCEFDAKGRLFAGSNGSHPGFHYLQHAYYRKNFGKHGSLSNPYAYGYFEGIQHPQFKRVTTSICVYEGDGLPERYQGQLIWANPVIGRFGASTLLQDGLGFKGEYIDQLVTTDHRWFRPVYVDFGPDGALYFADWYDQQVNHWRNYQGRISKKDGRIYRVAASDPFQPFDLNQRSTMDLLELLKHPNRWYRETARRLIDDRPDKAQLIRTLEAWLNEDDAQLALEALWALHLCDGIDRSVIKIGMRHPDPHVRRWTLRLIADQAVLAKEYAGPLLVFAQNEPDLEVRAQCASAALRLPNVLSVAILHGLLTHKEDVEDAHMPLMTWWVIEKVIREDLHYLSWLVEPSHWQDPDAMLSRHLAERLGRRLASDDRRSYLDFLGELLDATSGPSRANLLKGFQKAYEGRSLVGLPDSMVQHLAGKHGPMVLQLRQQKPEAIEQAARALADEQTEVDLIVRILEVVAEQPQPSLQQPALDLLDHSYAAVRLTAIQALAPYSDQRVYMVLADHYADWPREEQSAAREILTARSASSLYWLDQLKGAMPADVVDALERLGDPEILKRLPLSTHGSEPQLLESEIARVQKMLPGLTGDPYRGRIQFLARCVACHYLHNEGGSVGPDLTPYQRSDLASLATAIIHPNAEIREGFETMNLLLKDERLLSGFLVDETPQVIVLRQVNGRERVISRDKILETRYGKWSMMPEKLLTGMSDADIADLFAYLQRSQPLSQK